MKDIDRQRCELARRHLADFVQLTCPKYTMTDFHDVYTSVINLFASGKVKNLIVSVPPQHGKTLVSSQRLPPFMFGKDPDKKIVVASYAQTLARKFGREIRRIMTDKKYQAIFPGTRLAGSRDHGYTNTADVAEVVGHDGSLTLVGRGSGLTGNPVDTLIIDDLYKDAMEANSPVIRQAAIEWYQTVAETRLHNDSQQLIVFTRWHQEDLIGWLESQGIVDDLVSLKQLENPDPRRWLKINFEALKESEKTDFDWREKGEPLFPQRHSRQRLEDKKKQDGEVFASLYQGDPQPAEGLLYKGFDIYKDLPEVITDRIMYVDVADQGKDYLCGISGALSGDKLYITDILYTQDAGEVTEPAVYGMIKSGYIDTAWIESNSGGRAFARNVQRLCEEAAVRADIKAFHQSQNKEARILTNASAVQRHIVFPHDWQHRWPQFAKDLLNFRKLFKANTYDDGPDTLTGLFEKSGLDKPTEIPVYIG